MGEKMRVLKNVEMFALIAVVLWLTFALAPAFADAPPSTPTAITLSLSTKSVALDSSLTVSGSVTPSISGFPPVSGVNVTLAYTMPDGTTLDRTVTTGADGSFSNTYTPGVAGSWSVEASWAGDVAYLGATSSAEPFTVGNSSGSGIPMVYVYVVVVIIVIAVAALGAYLYTKKK